MNRDNSTRTSSRRGKILQMIFAAIVSHSNQGSRATENFRERSTLDSAKNARKLIGTDDVMQGHDVRNTDSNICENRMDAGSQAV